MIRPLLTLLLFLTVQFNSSAQAPLLHLQYNEASGSQSTFDIVSGNTFSITNSFGKPERVSGVVGNALRTDGFSTWASGSFTHDIGSQMTVETWISLESYPSDEELPYPYLTPSAIVSQFQGDLGFQIGINTFGDYWFSANVNNQRYICTAIDPFPLYEWVHVAGVIDGANGVMKLYLNGQEVASASIPINGQLNEASVPLIIGKSNENKIAGIFLINALNAAIDETKIYAVAKSKQNLESEYLYGMANVTTTGFEAITVSEDRFQDDLQRPIYHGMPPSGWTNEPHGLVEFNGQYHLFYQRTPNGPFKYQMHWGHMISPDFVHWTNAKDALWPSLEWSATTGYDMKGIWSGDVIIENGEAHAFYTNVNHTGPFNPGIAHATSSDQNLENWTKKGPVIDKQFVDDFRDPYLWKEGNVWNMIIGAKVNGGGGLDYYTSTDLTNWNHQSQFTSTSFNQMDIGSDIWEMPVFEHLENEKYLLITNPIGGTVQKYGPNYTRGVYWIGTWQNGQFTPDFTRPKMLDIIHGHLSPTVARTSNNRLVGIGIVDERRSSQAQLDAGWCHTFSLPRVYSLLPDNQTLGQSPAPELLSLRIPGSQQSYFNIAVNGVQPISAKGKTMEIIATVDPNTTGNKYGINFYVSNNREEVTSLYYDAVAQKIVLDKSNSSLSPNVEDGEVLTGDYDEQAFGKPQKFHVFLDNSVVDVFINDAAAFSNRVYPSLITSDGIELLSEGTTTFTAVDVWKLAQDATSVPVSGVHLNKSSTALALNTTEALEASVLPVNATIKTVSWTSSNDSVATVSSTGVITPVSLGTTIITATTDDGGFTAPCTVVVNEQSDYLVYDFESGDLSNWIATGDAFTDQDVTSDTDWGWGGPFNQQGTYHYWGAKNGDSRTGTLQSQDFILGGNGQITFLIGGGFDINTIYIALIRKSDGAELMKVTGDDNDSEAYVQKQFDASAYIGTECYIKVVDNATDGWGHINLDDIRIPIQAPVSVTGVSVNPTTVVLAEGDTITLTEVVSPLNATNSNVNWSSSNLSVATVDNTGVVTTNSPGSAIITVTTEDGEYTAQSVITVIEQQYLIYDFETGNLSGWTVTSGSAFTDGDVTSQNDWGWGGPFNQQGTYHYWGAKNGDSRTGTMQSQDFILGGNGQITFLIGGGFDINTTYIALIRKSDGAELMKATGEDNDSEAYTQRQFDAGAYIGTECYIKVVDNATGGWGHINLDNIVIPIEGVAQNNFANAYDSKSTSASSGTYEKTYKDIIIYPNPSNGHFYFEKKEEINVEDITISIISVDGKRIETFRVVYLNNNIKINHELSSGIYYLMVKIRDEVHYKKLLINN